MTDKKDKFIKVKKDGEEVVPTITLYKEIGYVSFPAIACQFIAVLQEVMNLIFAGMLNNEKQLAGVGLGNAMNAVFILGLFVGLNGAINTFASQSYGAKQIELCGVYYWRARISLFGLFLIMCPFQIFSCEFLKAIGQDEEASYWARVYMWSFYPGLVFMALLDLDRNYLTSFGKSDICMYCQMISPFIHVVVCYVLAIKLEYGVIGIGISGFITNFSVYKLQNYYMRNLELIKEANEVTMWDPRNRQNLKEYLKLGIPSMLFIIIEWSVFDISTIIAGYFGILE